MKKYYIIKSESGGVLPLSEEANEVMKAKGFEEYIKKYGYHFNQKLADCVTKKMKNADGSDHNWRTDQVTSTLRNSSMKIGSHCNEADMTYLANMAYADFFPNVIDNQTKCLEYASSVSRDPDGYEGIAFMRFIADLIGKKESVEWSKYL